VVQMVGMGLSWGVTYALFWVVMLAPFGLLWAAARLWPRGHVCPDPARGEAILYRAHARHRSSCPACAQAPVRRVGSAVARVVGGAWLLINAGVVLYLAITH
jgi:hypothetical protein